MSYTPVSNDPTDTALYDFDHRAIDDANQPPEIDPEIVAAATAPEDTTTRHGVLGPDDLLGGTNDTSNPANFPAGRASLPTDANPTRAGWDPNWGPPPGGSRTGTVNGIDITSSAGQPSPNDVQTGYGAPYVPDAAATGGTGYPSNLPPGLSNTPPSGLPGGVDPHFITRLGDQTPGAPGAGGGAPGAGAAAAGGGLPPQFANDPWAQKFYQENGYFDPRFNTADSIRQELQRGGTANWEQAQRMRGVNGDIDAIVDAIKRVGPENYFGGTNTQNWIGAHDNQITGDVNAGVYGHNQAAIANVASQRVNPLANPIDQYHAELTNAMQATLTDSLKALGATGVHSGFNNYGDATIDYFNKSGQPESIKATFVDLANAIDQLRQRAAAQQQAPPGGGGGGGGGYGGPRGGYAPPGGGGNPRPPPEVFAGGRPVPTSEGGYPRGVQSAYAFTPDIQPGGYSPYDEPKPNITNVGNTNFQPNPGTVGFGPFPPGSAGNPGMANGSNPEQRYANSPPSAAPIPVELVGQPPEVIAEMRRQGLIPSEFGPIRGRVAPTP